VARLDRQLAKVNARIAALHEQMATHASDFSRLADLDAELSDASADRDRLELAWLEAAELAET
jgi:ATP-binding cassette subfamily F protein uup